MILRLCWTLLILHAFPLFAQNVDSLLDRLNKLERDNTAMRQEMDALRAELAALKTTAEKTEVIERRVEEQAQAKVEASQKFPVRVRGMALVNLFHNGKHANGVDTPTTASRTPGRATAAATFRQTTVGLDFNGPRVWGAAVSGSVMGDFYEGNTETVQFAPARLRTANITMDWATRSLMIAQEKPLISPRDPNSLSFVGVSPLTSSGNLWRWQPQIRFEQRIGSREGTQLRLQGAIIQTSEESGGNPGTLSLERRRPGLEGRFELAHRFGEERRIEFAPGFHVSTSHVGPFSLPSKVFTMDWFANPVKLLEFSGTFFTGENLHHFGALRQGWVVVNNTAQAVHSRGGWAQVSVPFHPRISLNLFGGIMDDRNSDLLATSIGANKTGAANLMFRLAPNILVSLEALQTRTTYINGGTQRNPRYDLAIAYLF